MARSGNGAGTRRSRSRCCRPWRPCRAEAGEDVGDAPDREAQDQERDEAAGRPSRTRIACSASSIVALVASVRRRVSGADNRKRLLPPQGRCLVDRAARQDRPSFLPFRAILRDARLAGATRPRRERGRCRPAHRRETRRRARPGGSRGAEVRAPSGGTSRRLRRAASLASPDRAH